MSLASCILGIHDLEVERVDWNKGVDELKPFRSAHRFGLITGHIG